MALRVTIWNENWHETREERVISLYPKGLHGAIADAIGDIEDVEITIATFDMPEHGLTDEVLENTDVMIWWGHRIHHKVSDEIVDKVVNRVLNGMGFIALHSAHLSKPFKRLMGTICRLKVREANEKERIWVIDPSHPIAAGLPEYIELPKEETYGERFEIPAPDELVFASWFSGGEVFRSGCCFNRGLGKVFYFQPGHETVPTYHNPYIKKIIRNAVLWARPLDITPPTLGVFKSLEKNRDN